MRDYIVFMAGLNIILNLFGNALDLLASAEGLGRRSSGGMIKSLPPLPIPPVKQSAAPVKTAR